MNKPRTFLAAFILPALLSFQTLTFAQTTTPSPKPVDVTMDLVVGDMQTIDVKNLSRVSVTNPEVADISDAQGDKVTILGKKFGQTALFLWDDNGKQTVMIHVASQDLSTVEESIKNLVNKAGIYNLIIEANSAEGKIIISGNLPKEKKVQLDNVLDAYADQVINLAKEEVSEDLVQIDMQVTELGTTLDKKLGFDWQGGKGSPLALDYTETGLPTGGAKEWFKFGQFNRTTAIINTINLMINEGKARDLSRPRILVTSGKEATINVGGEVPIQSTTTSGAAGGISQSNVTFKQYGVTLTVTPTVRDGKIDVLMNIQVSDIDKTFYTAGGSTSDVAYKTRSAQTQLLLDDRQTVVFAGLIRYNDSSQVKRIPFLGKIPIVGALFRNTSKASPDEGKELVITLTPTIMRKKEYSSGQVKMPSQKLVDFEKEVDTVQKYEYEELPTAPPLPAKPVAEITPMPLSGAPIVMPGRSSNTIVTPYVRSIQTKISQAISYPYEALENNWQGTVKLRLHILKDGSLAQARVTETSGHEIFDQDALNTAKIVAPYLPFTTDMRNEELVVIVPIVYSQGNLSKADSETVTATY